MKKAFNEITVDNIESQNILSTWHFEKLITTEQLEHANSIFPVDFYKTNIFVKIGLFLFTQMVATASISFLSIFLIPLLGDSKIGIGILSLLSAVLFFFVLEYFIKKIRFFRSGVDNALIYIILGSFIIAFISFIGFDNPIWVYSLLGLVIFSIAFLYYADPLVAVLFFACWMTLWFVLATESSLGKTLLPFIIMGISAVTYWALQIWKSGAYYASSRSIIKTLALCTFYLGGNYLVVREGNALLNILTASTQINFASLFYFFSIITPILYIYLGLKNQERKLLIVGILTTSFSIFTFHHYYSFMPYAWELVIIGTLLILLTAFVINYLKTPKYRLTSKAVGINKFQNLEAFIVNQAIDQSGNSSGDMNFGGGDFGGAGAGGNY